MINLALIIGHVKFYGMPSNYQYVSESTLVDDFLTALAEIGLGRRLALLQAEYNNNTCTMFFQNNAYKMRIADCPEYRYKVKVVTCKSNDMAAAKALQVELNSQLENGH